MNFNKHYDLRGEHAFLSASKYHWLNYSEDKITDAYRKFLAIQKGTVLHDFARQCIDLRVKLPKTRKSLNCFVNDAIGFRMATEQPLFYSVNAFGTTDAICFRDKTLRIHDLKTGATPVKMQQLEVYAALFCLEYKQEPTNIEIELRIYQSDEIIVHKPEGSEIREIMEKIIEFDKRIEEVKTDEMED